MTACGNKESETVTPDNSTTPEAVEPQPTQEATGTEETTSRDDTGVYPNATGLTEVAMGVTEDICTFNLKPNQCGMSIPKEEGIERINVVIFGLKNTTMIPYILYIAKNVQDKNELNKMYGILESYIMRRVVVHASTKSYNNLFTSLILNKVLDSQTLTLRLKGIGDATTYCPDDNEMKIGFETSKLVNLQSKGIIYLLESKIRSDNSSTALLGFNNYSLEHLMPKKWRNNWGACATEDDAKKRDSLLLTLGNLAIIPQALNASIRDAAWNVKKAGKGQNKPGLLLCASGLYTLHDVLQKNDWNEHEIENRAEWLLANAQNIWKI